MNKSAQDKRHRFHRLTLEMAHYHFCMASDTQINPGAMWVESALEYGKQNVDSLGPPWSLEVDYSILPSGP